MHIQIRQQQNQLRTLAPGMLEHVEQRVHFALSRFNGDIRAVSVDLEDGAAPKRCTLEVRTAWGSVITVQEADPDLFVAVSRATERASRAVDRQAALRYKLQH